HTFFHFIRHPKPASTLFPYTTLFRSERKRRASCRRSLTARCSLSQKPPMMPQTLPSNTVSPCCVATATLRRLFRLENRRTFRNPDRKSTRLNYSHVKISYAVFCLKKK